MTATVCLQNCRLEPIGHVHSKRTSYGARPVSCGLTTPQRSSHADSMPSPRPKVRLPAHIVMGSLGQPPVHTRASQRMGRVIASHEGTRLRSMGHAAFSLACSDCSLADFCSATFW